MESPAKGRMTKSSPNTPGRAEDALGTSARILEAAERVLASKGAAGLSIANIAAEANVYRAAVSYHFGSKKQLLVRLVQARYEYFQEQAEAAIRTGDEADGVRSIIEKWVDIDPPDNDLLFFETLGYALRDPTLHDDLKTFYVRWTATVVELLGGRITGTDEEIRASGLVVRMLIDGMTIERLINPESRGWRIAAEAVEKMFSAYHSGPSGEFS